jgi:hypothetical protein
MHALPLFQADTPPCFAKLALAVPDHVDDIEIVLHHTVNLDQLPQKLTKLSINSALSTDLATKALSQLHRFTNLKSLDIVDQWSGILVSHTSFPPSLSHLTVRGMLVSCIKSLANHCTQLKSLSTLFPRQWQEHLD